MSKKHVLENFNPRSVNDLFGLTSTSADINAEEERVVEINLNDLHTFKNHPFSVLDDEKMQETVDSVKEHGVLVPGIVRRRASGGYEIISGHRRKRACQLAGLKTMPVFIRDLSDDEATIVMVDSNIQREEILPSEKAKAYSMKYEALKHQGKTDGKGDSLEQMAKEMGESRATIQRYVTVADMQPELLELMDDKTIGITQAVNFSSLTEEEQKEVANVVKETTSKPTKEQSKEIKKLSKEGNLDKKAVEKILKQKQEKKTAVKNESNSEEKKESKQKRRVSLEEEYLSKYFSDDYTEKQIRDIIDGLLDDWKKTTSK